MSHGIKLHIWGDFACFTRPEMKAERVSYDVITPSAARGILEAIYWKPQIRWVIDSIEVLKPIRFTNIRRNEVGSTMTVPSEEFRETGKQTAKAPKVGKATVSGTLKNVFISCGERVEKKMILAEIIDSSGRLIQLESTSTGHVVEIRKSVNDTLASGDDFFRFVPDIGIESSDSEVRQQRGSLILRDVAYLVEAHFEVRPPYVLESGGIEVSKKHCEVKHLNCFNRRARNGQFFHHPYLGTREFPANFELIEEDTKRPASQLPYEHRDHDFGFMLHDIAFDQDPRTKQIKDTTPRFYRAEMKGGIITVPPFHQTRA